MAKIDNQEHFAQTALESIFRTSKKTIQEYIQAIEYNNRYRSTRGVVGASDWVMDSRSKLIDLYDACYTQDANLQSVLETMYAGLLGERYMLARQTSSGQWIKDITESEKIQGSAFTKIIKGIVDADLYGYTLIEILNSVDPVTGKLNKVNLIERRNVLPDQEVVLKRQDQWGEHWNLNDPTYINNYVLVNTGGIGKFGATTPLILAKKFTFANYVNFAHTYGLPIMWGQTDVSDTTARKKLATDIASAAQNRVLVTGIDDKFGVVSPTMSNSDRVFMSLIGYVDKSVGNLIVGSESMSGEAVAYKGTSESNEDVFRNRIECYREFIENTINEQIIPRLVKMGYIKPGLSFKYSTKNEMSNTDKIKLYDMLTNRYVVTPEEIEKEFGVIVGTQINAVKGEPVSTSPAPKTPFRKGMSKQA